MIIELPNYVLQSDVAEIRATLRAHMPKDQTYVYNREGKSLYIWQHPELQELDQKLAGIFSEVQQNVLKHRYQIHRPSSDSGYEFHSYGAGQVCHYHADGEFAATAEPGIFRLRYASVVLHLNTIEEGGELVFPSQNQSVKTEAGKIVIFPPYPMFSHYTTPAKEDRDVVMTWFTYPDVVLKQG
jgi:predicted 2-oxoglutarate/Fe(II)-dependent dioxygenase YbiX